MAELTTWFVCRRSQLDDWLEALAREDEAVREAVEAAMAAVWEAEGVTHVEVNILAQCYYG